MRAHPEANAFDDDASRALRAHWFTYLDALEPVRADLHGYCRRLTRNVWDAEDLVQDTLLRGFGMAARGDFHGPDSPVRDAHAYLLRTATHRWIDTLRRRARETALAEPVEVPDAGPPADPVETAESLDRAVASTSPQEFAALVLRSVFDYSAEEIADFVGTTAGTVKSALSRARGKLTADRPTASPSPERAALAAALAEALSAGDVDRVEALMEEAVQIVVCNVGGGRGRSGIWTKKTVVGIDARPAEYAGEAIVLLLRSRDGALADVLRVAGGERIVRLIDHCYAPETLAEVAAAFGLDAVTVGYHQGADVLPGMIATTTLPWRSA